MSRNIVLLLLLFAIAIAQRTTHIKPGDCPPPYVGICSITCNRDIECYGQEKCCPTACGGTLCTAPVTMRRQNIVSEKPGSCPVKPSGAWVCSNTCSYDSDCRGRLKCCKGRCPGSMRCSKPEI